MRRELLLDDTERVRAHDHVDGTIGGEEHQASGLSAPGKGRDEIERRVVAPVDVFQHEHEWHLGGQRLERLGHLAEHPLPRGAEDLSLETIAVGRRNQRRHLGEPGWRSASSTVMTLSPSARRPSRPRASSTACSSHPRREDRAEPARRRHAPTFQPLDEQVNECGLAHARLAGDEHDLSLAFKSQVKAPFEPVKLGVAANRVQGRTRGAAAPAPAGVASRRRSGVSSSASGHPAATGAMNR